MLLLAVILFCLLSYKFFTKWIWIILPFAIIYDLGLWIVDCFALDVVCYDCPNFVRTLRSFHL